MRKRTTGVSAVLLLALAGAALASDPEDVTKLPGYVDFGVMNIFGKGEPTVEIIIESNLMNMVAAMMRNSDPELSNALAKLKQIRVQTFPIEQDQLEALERKVTDVSKRLDQAGWQKMVSVKQPRQNKQTYVYMKWVNNIMEGLVVMDVDPKDEASFVNIVGQIDPEQIGNISSKFNFDSGDIDSLENVIKDHGRHKDRDRDKGKSKE